MDSNENSAAAASESGLGSIDLAGTWVSNVSAGLYSVNLVLQGDDPRAPSSVVGIESSVTLVDSVGGRERADSDDSMLDASRLLLRLLGKHVEAHTFDGRDLEVRFSSGEVLTVHRKDMPYESYQVTHHGITYVVGPLPA
ncbi:DUF6188 family protein [Aeromicrobium marinum]|uniref:DUF6188 family protein n=1 Tax=Aeromicrobium marinum TaxID=219314 RepID=UPI0012E9F934|nr:DUF6188 family protein [Aeromicrobium marinum]